MRLKTGLVKNMVSIGLLVALLFPFTIQFLHALEGHDHPVCTEVSDHCHAEPSDCDVCDFQFKVIEYQISFYELPASTFYFTTFQNSYSNSLTSSYLTGHKQLRAPPVFS